MGRGGDATTADGEEEAWRQRAVAAAQRDATAARQECPLGMPAPGTPLGRAGLALLRDPRDAPILWLMVSFAGYVAVGAPLLFLFTSHLAGFAYLALLLVVFLQRFTLGMHYSAHRPMFKKGAAGDLLNAVPTWLLAPFMGVAPGMYGTHHLIMHHGEDNGFPEDLSSTEQYRRDNFFHFLIYWARHTFLALFELPLYARSKGRHDIFWKSVVAELIYFAFLRYLWSLNSVATAWVFVAPYFITSFALMFGNWSQHIFVDGSKPRGGYSNTFNWTSHPDNMKAFNDGYHVLHHLNSRLHWSEFPAQFIASLDTMHEKEALSFEDVSLFEIGACVFLGKLDYLATKVITPHGRTKQELVQMMEKRLVPFRKE